MWYFLFLRNHSKTPAESPAASKACSWRNKEQQWSQQCLLSLKKGRVGKKQQKYFQFSVRPLSCNTPRATPRSSHSGCHNSVQAACPQVPHEGVLGSVMSQGTARLVFYPQQSHSEYRTPCQRLAHLWTSISPQEAEFTSKASFPLCLSGVTALTQF